MTHYNLKKPQREENVWEEEGTPFLNQNNSSPCPSWLSNLPSSFILPWILLILVVSINIFSILTSQDVSLWTSTDFSVSTRPAISNKLVKFSSSLDFIDEDTIFRVFNLDEPVYVGNRTEVDRNWEELINLEKNDVRITPDEAKSVGGNPWRGLGLEGHTIEIEVFHSLHCLNTIRKRINSHEYPEMLSTNAQVHVDHCIEALRELIMCGGNMTPIPLKWSENGKRMNPDFATVHECRDFGKLKAWLEERG